MRLILSTPGLEGESAGGAVAMSRFQAAQNAIQSMLFEMMINSTAGSLASIIVTKTRETRHHMKKMVGDPEDSIFPNITEICYDDILENEVPMLFPSAKMIKEMWEIEPIESIEDATLNVKGDLCDALIVAADALHNATISKKTGKPFSMERKVVILSDVGHHIVVSLSSGSVNFSCISPFLHNCLL